MSSNLLELLEYDHWATQQWLEAWSRWREPAKADEVVAHLLGAKRIWLNRVSGDDVPAEEKLLHEGWLRAVERIDPESVIDYRTMAGAPFRNTLTEIVRHLVNHGSYHRGEFRRLAADGGMEDWPETDWILFYRLKSSSGG